MAPSANPCIRCQVKSELQYDYVAQVPQQFSFGMGSAIGTYISATTRTNSSVNLYAIQGNSVFAYQETRHTSDASPEWEVVDTGFPVGNIPTTLQCVTIGNPAIDVVAVVSQSSDVWVLKSYTDIAPSLEWKNFSSPEDSNITNAKPFRTYDGKLLLAAISKGGGGRDSIYLLDVTNTDQPWSWDEGVYSNVTIIRDFIPDSTFWHPSNASKFGYLITGDGVTNNQPGVIQLTGAVAVPVKSVVAAGSYSSAMNVDLPFVDSLPLVFAINQGTHKAVYFSARESGYDEVKLFSDIQVLQIQAVLHKSTNEFDQEKYHVDVYALDTSGHLLHVASKPFDDISIRQNGYCAVSGWGDFTELTTGVKAILVASSHEKFSSLILATEGGMLEQWIQDPDTTDWITKTINIPSLSEVAKVKVYYTEVTVMDENNLPVAEAIASFGGIQYAKLLVNGNLAIVTPERRYETRTNHLGKLCITIHAPNALAAPTINLWVAGMEIGDLMDIQSTGKIQQRFRGIDVNDLKAAKNQVTCNMLFSNETDDTLEELATTLNTVMGVTAPSPSNSDCELSRKYIHPSTSSDVCATRRRHQLSLGHIRGSSGGGFEISFHYDNPNKKLSCRVLAAQEANEMIQGRLDGGTKLDIPWGDLFSNIRDGFLKVVKVLATSVVGGVKAVIDLTVNGVPRFWDGIIRYVRQAFDVAGAAFAHVHCQFSDLFGWLAYILDWDDIKNSAGVFKGYLKDFKTSCSDWLENVLPLATDQFFDTCKTDFLAKFDAAESALSDNPDFAIGFYDAKGSGGSKIDEKLQEMPSTASWLDNKLVNTPPEDGSVEFSGPAAQGLQHRYAQFVGPVGSQLSDNLKSAITEISSTFTKFTTRDSMDGVSLADVLKVAKDLVIAILDTLKALVTLFGKLVAECLNLLDDMLNAPIGFPPLAAIFKNATGEDLSVINAVCYSVAIPFTILYKLVKGSSPFPKAQIGEQAAVRPPSVDELMCYRGVLTFIFAPIDMGLDIAGYGRVPVPRYINVLGFAIPALNLCLSDFLTRDPQNLPLRQRVSIAVAATSPVLTMIWLAMSGLKQGPRGSLVGQLILGGAGVATFAVGVWLIVDLEKTPRNIAIISAKLVGSLSLMVKIFRVIPPNPKTPILAAIVPVVDGVAGISSGMALMVASELPQS